MRRLSKRSESRVELRVIATNPATRIQIVSESRRICLPEAATGESKALLAPGQYHILYWIHTSPVSRVTVDLQEDTAVTLERAVLKPSRLPIDVLTDRIDPLSRSSYVVRAEWPNRHVTLWAEILDPRSQIYTPFDVYNSDSSDKWPTLFLACAGLLPSSAPVPSDWSHYLGWEPFNGARTKERQVDVIVVGKSERKRVGLRHTVPTPDGTSAFVHFTRTLAGAFESTKSGLAQDWRVARYALQLMDRTADTPESREEFEDGEALIDRLGEPGRVPMPTANLDRRAIRTNMLASVAEWLLATRSLGWGKDSSEDLPNALFGAIPSEGAVAEIPDVQLLQLMSALSLKEGIGGSAKYERPLHLLTPVFSETWRILSRVPLANWRRRPVLIDSGALRAAQSASVGGVWFGWQAPFDPDVAEPASEQYDLTAAMEEALRRACELADTVRNSLDQPQESDHYFTHLVRWESRSPLERQILNYLTAPLDQQDGNGADDAKILEALSAELRLPLPIIADAVVHIARGHDDTNSPLRNPQDSPSSGVEKDREYEREYTYA